MLYAFAALLLFQFAGELLVRVTGLDVPGPLAGTVLLLLALIAYGRVPAVLEQTSAALLQNLMLLFIPTVAAVMLHGEYLAAQWLPFVVSAVLATVVTLAVTVLTFKAAVLWLGRRDANASGEGETTTQAATVPTSPQNGLSTSRPQKGCDSSGAENAENADHSATHSAAQPDQGRPT